MENLFSNHADTYRMVCGAYKKLKSLAFYDKSAYALKEKIASLEFDRGNFQNTLSNLTDALVNQKFDYFRSKFENIYFTILPKKFESDNLREDTVPGYTNHNLNLKSVNFFIDMPIELHIVDCLWTLLLGKLTDKTKNFYKFAAATRFKPSLFIKDEDDLYKGIEFESNRSFVPYFELYRRWRNGAFKKIKRVHSNKSTVLLCLDIKSFYYSVEFDFKKINSYFNYDPRLETFSFLTNIMESIYNSYTKVISSYKKGIMNRKATSVFPIGMVSSYVLREIYLYALDTKIVNRLKPLYYQRYVDDILLVVNANGKEDLKKPEAIKSYLIDTNIVTQKTDQAKEKCILKISGYSNLFIQQNKVNYFVFPRNEQTLLLDVYEEVIEQNTSMVDMLPDFGILKSSFRRNAYTLKNIEISKKLRDVGFLQSNNYNATKYIISLLRLIKDTKDFPREIDKLVDQIVEFYKGSQGLEFSNNWSTIFELFIICHAKSRALEFYRAVEESINNITLDNIPSEELNERRKDTVLCTLKVSLKRKLDIALSMAVVHDPQVSSSSRIQETANKLREANLYNHNILSDSLVNYIHNCKNDDKYTSGYIKSARDIFDDFRMKWSPRFIHLNEIYIAFFRVCNDFNIDINPDDVFDFYVCCNQLNYNIERPLFEQGQPSLKGINIDTYSYNSDVTPNPKVALVNTRITEEDVEKSITDPDYPLTFVNKERLFKIINIAIEERVNTIVFPEYYFPLKWLHDIAKFVTKFNITLISGLSIFVNSNKASNVLFALIPIGKKKKFKTGLMIFREKNFYTPIEKIVFSRYNLTCKNREIPTYYICDNGFYRFGTILCYEFTEILSRANYKEQIEVLFVPQLNKDTNYFSAIVESASRDLHCFVIQANTSVFGDSRITAPYKSLFKNLLQVRGGENDVVLISTIDTITLKKARESFASRVQKQMKVCRECTEQKSFEHCGNCKKMAYKDGLIKDPAPRVE